jgi:NitT/TauT family transport system permease protein
MSAAKPLNEVAPMAETPVAPPLADDDRSRGRPLVSAVMRVVYPSAAILLMLVIWELWVRLGDVSPFVMPRATEVVSGVFSQFSDQLPDIWVTFREIVLGFGLSAVVGVLLAFALVSSRVFELSIYPLLIGSQIVPKVAIAPLIIVWLGFGIMSKVLIAFSLAFFPVVINSVAGLRSIEIERLHLARSMGASHLQTFVKIRFPAALPHIFGGLKLAATFSVIGAVVGEFVASDNGLGHRLLAAGANFDTVTVFVTITYLTIMGVIIFMVIEVVERLALPWHAAQRKAK